MANKEKTHSASLAHAIAAGNAQQALTAAGITVVPFGPAEDDPVELQQNRSTQREANRNQQ